GATTRMITVSQNTTTTYSVTVTTLSGCSATASKSVIIASNSNVTITAPATVVANTGGHNASGPAGPSGTTDNWSITNGSTTAGQGTNAITFSAGSVSPLTINVNVDNAGCISTGSANVALAAQADLAISIAAPSSVNTGAPIAYVINVTNFG